jgi:hypothetical protein
MRQHRFYRNPRRKVVDLQAAFDTVSPDVAHAARAASAMLTEAGVRHVLVGGLAVGAHGYPRATKDVDFLVGEEAFVHHEGGIVTIAPGIPVLIGDVPIDALSAIDEDEFLEEILDEPLAEEIPLAPVDALVYLKLKSPRSRDRQDIIELIHAGIDRDEVIDYLHFHLYEHPSLKDYVRRFRALTEAADREED